MNSRVWLGLLFKISRFPTKLSNLTVLSLAIAFAFLSMILAWHRSHLFVGDLEPIGLTSSYGLEQLNQLKTHPEFDIRWYTRYQLTVGMAYPVILSLLVAALVARLSTRAILRISTVAAGTLLITSEWGENLLLAAIFQMTAPPPWLALVASSLTWGKLFGIVGLVLSLIVALYRRYYTLIDRILYKRYPILAIILLTFWTIWASLVPGLNSIGANLLLLDDTSQVIFIATANYLALIFSFSIFRLLHARHRIMRGKEFSGSSRPWRIVDLGLLGVLASLSPLVCFIASYRNSWFLAPEPLWLQLTLFWLADVTGILVAVGLLFILGQINGWFLRNSSPISCHLFPFQAPHLATHVSRKQRFLGAADLQLAVYFTLLVAIFFGAIRPNSDVVDRSFLSIPALAIILIWLVMMVLAALSYWMSRSRIPVIVVVVLWIVLLRALTSHESTLKTVAIAREPPKSVSAFIETSNAEDDQFLSANFQSVDAIAMRAIQRRMLRVKERHYPSQRQGIARGSTLIVVTCPGGGIHAAAWSAYVLEQLHRRYEDFSDSIAVISGVSGGSHGALVFVNGLRQEQEFGVVDQEPEHWKTAAASSLWPLGTGLAFDDVPATLIPKPFELDRGNRLESAWQRRLGYLDSSRASAVERAKVRDQDANSQTLNAWGRKAERGFLPIVVFNATDAVSGRRVLFSTVPSPLRSSLTGSVGRPWDIRELFEVSKYDLPIASAARASATFPYATPFTRPQHPTSLGEQVAIGDGGYVDNEGIVTAVDWIEFLWRAQREEAGVAQLYDRILLLRIQPSAEVDRSKQGTNVVAGLLERIRWLAGPLETLVSMRVSSQIERGHLETDLLSLATSNGQSQLRTNTTTDSNNFAGTNQPTGMQRVDLEKQGRHQATRGDSSNQQYVQAVQAMQQSAKHPQDLEKLLEPPAGERRESFGLPSNDSTTTPNSIEPSSLDRGVVVVRLPFTTEPGTQMPLSWKLSERQKLEYPLAWQRLLQQEGFFFSELDALFQRRKAR